MAGIKSMQILRRSLTHISVKYRTAYNNIYRFHRFLKRKVFNAEDIFGWVFACLVVGISYLSFKPQFLQVGKRTPTNVTLDDFKPLFIYLFLLLAYWLTGKFIQLYIQNTGLLTNFILPGRFLLRDQMEKGCRLNLDGIDSSLFQFVTEDNIGLATEMNVKAYGKGPWGAFYHEKLDRNSSHIAKNGQSMMLFKFENEGPFVGYTHIFPVSHDTWLDYSKGLIPDNKFSGDYIVSGSSRFINEKPYGLIIFSAVCTEIFWDEYDPYNEYRYQIFLGDVIEKAAVYHVKQLLNSHFSERSGNHYNKVNIVTQNEAATIKDFFKGYANMDAVSADGGTIIHFRVQND